jgi:hypothetical protein
MALNEDRPGTAFPGVIGRAFDHSSPTWPRPLPAALLAGSAAAETIPIAVIASVTGWPVATARQQRATRHPVRSSTGQPMNLAPVTA